MSLCALVLDVAAQDTVLAQAAPKRALAASAVQAPTPAPTRPTWAELTGEQRRALAPLEQPWPRISSSQKRKWISLSSRYDSLSVDEQRTLHVRMNEWVAMTPTQRSQARLSFGEIREMSAEDKRAAWEAYQALSAAERQELARTAPGTVPSPALSPKPIPREKLVTVKTPAAPEKGQAPPRGARIPVAPQGLTPNTLLPAPPPVETAAEEGIHPSPD